MWSVFSFALRPLYFTPTQFPESVGINVFNGLVNGIETGSHGPVRRSFNRSDFTN